MQSRFGGGYCRTLSLYRNGAAVRVLGRSYGTQRNTGAGQRDSSAIAVRVRGPADVPLPGCRTWRIAADRGRNSGRNVKRNTEPDSRNGSRSLHHRQFQRERSGGDIGRFRRPVPCPELPAAGAPGSSRCSPHRQGHGNRLRCGFHHAAAAESRPAGGSNRFSAPGSSLCRRLRDSDYNAQ